MKSGHTALASIPNSLGIYPPILSFYLWVHRGVHSGGTGAGWWGGDGGSKARSYVEIGGREGLGVDVGCHFLPFPCP